MPCPLGAPDRDMKKTILVYGSLGGLLIAALKFIEYRFLVLERYAVMYGNPLINAALTFLEPLPVALVVALVSAGVLSRKRKEEVIAVAA